MLVPYPRRKTVVTLHQHENNAILTLPAPVLSRVRTVVRPIRLIRNTSCVGDKHFVIPSAELTLSPHLKGVTDVPISGS